jgi:hypothetical protein
MPKPKTTDLLPQEIRQELEQRLQDNGFGGYTELSEWLESQGFRISRTTIGRFGKEFKERCKAIRTARMMAIAYKEELPEDEGAVSEILTEVGKGLILEYAFLVQETLCGNNNGLDKLRTLTPLVATAARSIEAINRSDIAIAKYVTELKERQAAKLEELKSEGQQLGITEEYLKRIESEWLGLF